MASATGLFNQHTRQWDQELIQELGLDPERLPPLLPLEPIGTELRPEFAARWPELRGCPWLPAVGDGACSNLGAGCATRERLALMVGTSGAERVAYRAERVEVPPGVWCYRVDAARPVLGGAVNDGGNLFEWLSETLRLPATAEAEAEVADLPPDAHGLTVLPLWGGERSPGWSDDATGAIVGLRLHTRPTEILRAALEGMALRLAEIDAALRQTVPEAHEVVATGGGLLRSPAWLQIVADVLGRPVLASTELEASSRGAALLALEALGALDGPLEALPPPAGRVYQPVAAHTERYRAAARRQRRLYEQLVLGS
jgi:gluconokinase